MIITLWGSTQNILVAKWLLGFFSSSQQLFSVAKLASGIFFSSQWAPENSFIFVASNFF